MERIPIDSAASCRQNQNIQLGQQESWGNGRRSDCPFRVFEVDHIIPCGTGGQDSIENRQLLCAHCNRMKGDRPQEYLVARSRELGIVA